MNTVHICYHGVCEGPLCGVELSAVASLCCLKVVHGRLINVNVSFARELDPWSTVNGILLLRYFVDGTVTDACLHTCQLTIM